jgi:hypothetical protein
MMFGVISEDKEPKKQKKSVGYFVDKNGIQFSCFEFPLFSCLLHNKAQGVQKN